jgi:hypothetical protein
MKKIAHIQNGTVVNISLCEDNATPIVPEDMTVVELSGQNATTVRIGDAYANGVFTPAPSIPVDPPVVTSIEAAEQWIAYYFSVARLLQMKVWLDIVGNAAPKLNACFAWTGVVTATAAAGVSVFNPPPHTFEEVVAEVMPILNP